MNRLPVLVLILFIFLLPNVAYTLPSPEDQVFRLGVLSFRPKDQTLKQFSPLAAYLEKNLGRRTRITAYGFEELDGAVANNQVDLVITNPGHYIQLQHRHQLSSPLASLILQEGAHELSTFGGVIFTRTDKPDIRQIKELRGRKIAVVSTSSLGGCQTQLFEMFEAGMKLPGRGSMLTTGMPHDNVVRAVLDGRAEVGFVRTGVLEAMAREGALDLQAIKIIHQQNFPSYPYRTSTRLYPEWAISAHRNVDEDTTRQITIALLSVAPGTLQGIHGFGIPADYSGIVDLLRSLRLAPFDKAPEFTLADLLKKYLEWIMALGVMGGLLIFATIGLTIQNRKVRQGQASLLESHGRLAEQEEKFRTVADYTLDWEYWESPEHEQIYMSPSAERITGYPREAFIADQSLLKRIIHPDDRPHLEEHLSHFCGPDDGLLEFRIINRDGSIRWLEHVCHPVSGTDGSFRGRRVSNRDVTDRKQAEEALKESNLLNRQIIACAHEGVIVYDKELRYRLWNPFMEVLTGLKQQEVLGRNPWDIFPFLKESGVIDHLELALTGQVPDVSVFPYSINGKSGWVVDSSAPLKNDSGEIIGVIATVQDITERKHADDERIKLEKQLLHAQKLESLGVLAGGIAHDFNNILTAIIGNADMAMMRLTPESPVLENLQRIEKAAARAADLAKQMLAYSGKGKFIVEPIDLNRLVEDMEHMLEVSISKKAVIRFDLVRPIPPVDADATQIRQILMNLVINGSEAIGDKSGVISISTGCMHCSKEYLKDSWMADPLPEGAYVFLEVGDNGCGMDKETLAKIFDPFFTTKFAGRGLGMAAVLGIVRGHKGAIKIYSEKGKGSNFKVLLPVGERPAEHENGMPGTNGWKGTGTVLLVDDEETVLEIGGEILRELGFDVVTAENGRQALEVYKSRNDISLIILDLTMPKMDGEQCFRELRQINQDVKVIISSGFTESEITAKFLGKGLAGFIQKPYKSSELVNILKSIGAE